MNLYCAVRGGRPCNSPIPGCRTFSLKALATTAQPPTLLLPAAECRNLEGLLAILILLTRPLWQSPKCIPCVNVGAPPLPLLGPLSTLLSTQIPSPLQLTRVESIDTRGVIPKLYIATSGPAGLHVPLPSLAMRRWELLKSPQTVTLPVLMKL